MSTTQTSRGSRSSRSDFDNSAKYYYNYGYEAVMYGTDDNCRRRYLVCPLDVNCNSFIVDPFIFEPLVVFYNSSSTNESVCQYLAVVDPDYPKQARDIIDQLTDELREVRDLRIGGHDFWLKRSQIRHDKAIIIRRLQASVNKLKTTLLEKGHTVRASEETNMKLAVAMLCAQRRCKAWMITWAITLLILLPMFAHVIN
ncbi:hypothetical protein Cgig2_001656 [Carnegiea gigantea]|uniref:Uncharacterized protein n=1 Tax=Carnegiea gigantea TaxID=171969 RepID=A0A9Q1Q5Y0_9CARY|nr:hypothetical protein Cgig2_001656 [Carnegiea gigantea]